MESETLTRRVPAAFRDPDNEWFALTLRARIAHASVERVPEGSQRATKTWRIRPFRASSARATASILTTLRSSQTLPSAGEKKR